jgi:hypothetical protein
VPGGWLPGGRVVRVTPDGVVTVRTPSPVVVNRQPGAWVSSRWYRRHRQPGCRHVRSRARTNRSGTAHEQAASPACRGQPRRTSRSSSHRVTVARSAPVPGSVRGDGQRAPGGRLHPARADRVQLLQQLPQLPGGDRRPVHRRSMSIGGRPGALIAGGTSGGPGAEDRQGRQDLQVRGHRRAGGVPRPQDQIRRHRRPQLIDRPPSAANGERPSAIERNSSTSRASDNPAGASSSVTRDRRRVTPAGSGPNASGSNGTAQPPSPRTHRPPAHDRTSHGVRRPGLVEERPPIPPQLRARRPAARPRCRPARSRAADRRAPAGGWSSAARAGRPRPAARRPGRSWRRRCRGRP